MQTMSLNEVCKLLKITDQTGRNRLSSGMPMPPNFRVGRRRLFIEEDVLDWIKGQSTSTIKVTQISQVAITPVLRGRPTKASLMGHQK
jgi:Helix-turn-helix domain